MIIRERLEWYESELMRHNNKDFYFHDTLAAFYDVVYLLGMLDRDTSIYQSEFWKKYNYDPDEGPTAADMVRGKITDLVDKYADEIRDKISKED